MKFLFALVRCYPAVLYGFYKSYWGMMFARQDLEDMNRLKRGFIWDLGQHWLHVLMAPLRIVGYTIKWAFTILRATFSLAIFLLCLAIGIIFPLLAILLTPRVAWLHVKGESDFMKNLEKRAEEL